MKNRFFAEQNMVTDTIPLNQKRANDRKAKAIAAAGMLGVATLFGATACKHPTDPTPQEKPKDESKGPTFEEFFIVENINHPDSTGIVLYLKGLYNRLDPEYILALKDRQLNVQLRDNGSIFIDTFLTSSNGLKVYGTSGIENSDALKGIINYYFPDLA
jgi:hypothetical protein